MSVEQRQSTNLPITLRPDWLAFALFGGLTVFLWLPGLTEMQLGRSHASRDLAIGVGASVLIFLLLYFWNIEISEEGITYRKLLFRKTFMPYSSMKEARIETSVFRNRRTRGRPVYCLLLLPNSENTPSLIINIKPFSRDGLSLLIRTISEKALQVQFDAACERMKNKVMPSVLFPENRSSEDRPDCANTR